MWSLRLYVWDGVHVAVGEGYGIEIEAVAGSESVEFVVICSAEGLVCLRHDHNARKFGLVDFREMFTGKLGICVVLMSTVGMHLSDVAEA